MNCKDALASALAAADQLMGNSDSPGLYAMGYSNVTKQHVAMVIVRGEEAVKDLLAYHKSNSDGSDYTPPAEYPDFGNN